jgi:hypothetical protein
MQRFVHLLSCNRVELSVWLKLPVHPKGTKLRNVFYEKGSSNAEYIVQHNVNLPTNLKIREKDAATFLQLLARYDTESIAH